MKEEVRHEEQRKTCSFAIDARHASRFTAIRKKQRREMEFWALELARKSKGKITRAQARLEARRQRPAMWPTLDEYVERAIRLRLAEDDLSGPWEPLTTAEEEEASLSGRGIGKNYKGRGRLVVRTYDLPSSLVNELRATAVRVSEAPLEELEELGLLYNSLSYSEEEREQRDALVERVFSAARIVREALERYGPWPPDEDPAPAS
ncbi:hypothetical protein ACFUJY_29505 [Streptomyces sp. NPDC057249]|uniref:hypothetical protein n=1 Tax=Streptomyces sp. NPDC057249 TaxID=3346067 RepID=UPI0036333756